MSPILVDINVLHQISQKCPHNWWKSGGFTNLGDNSIEIVLEFLYALPLIFTPFIMFYVPTEQ